MPKALSDRDHLYLVDGSSYIFRAYHALPPLTRKSDGLPVGAVSGFCNMLVKLCDDMNADGKPTHLAVIFDAKGPNFRHELYDAYKANRGAPPEDLVPQFPLVRDAVRAFGIPSIELEGFEADDLIATYARAASAMGARVTIVSSDKDLMQLVDGRIDMLDTMKNNVIGPDEVLEKFGVAPDKVIDVQSLAGDSVDNIPGVPGIGVKTAAQLIETFGDLDSLLARAEEIPQPKRRQSLIDYADQARLSRELVTLRCDTPMPCGLAEMALKDPEPQVLIGFLKAMEFNTITQRMAKRYGVDVDAIAADLTSDLSVSGGDQSRLQNATHSAADQQSSVEANGQATKPLPDFLPIDPAGYMCISDRPTLDLWVAEAFEAGVVAIDTETDGLDALQCRLVGISIATAPGRAAYIPIAHGADTLSLEEQAPQLPLAEIVAALSELLQADHVLKILQNAKFDLHILRRHGLVVSPIDDTMLISYALDAGLHGHGMDELSQIWLDHTPISIKSLLGSGKNQITFDRVAIDEATRYAAEDADITLRLWHCLKPRLAEAGVAHVYESTERALIPVIVEMEAAGICVDRDILSRLSGRFAQKMAQIEADIYVAAGETFNIASPKQLGEVMFDRLGLPGAKKTKTGAYATGADILEDLAAQGHQLPAHVLDWRGLAKLKSTYTDALPEFIHGETGRIHTSYSLAATTTGRLSSSDPNLQNIPIRTEDGRQIRTAFIAAPGHVLISADYSQIELRLLAHIADIEPLKQAFAEGQDIHAMTASEIFGVPLKDMTSEIRRRAKAINFGIIYGISAFGLANQLGIARGDAAHYIDTYFQRFPGIRDYMENTKAEARAHGYVRTLFGRKIHTKDIQAKQPALRAFAERAAINAPIQGTAADIIRRAMVQLPAHLDDLSFPVRMLLQVHDELIFETPEQHSDAAMQRVCSVMEHACAPRVHLSVPLIVDARAAQNWDEAH